VALGQRAEAKEQLGVIRRNGLAIRCAWVCEVAVALIYAAGLSVVRDLARTDTSTDAPQLPYQLLEGEEVRRCLSVVSRSV